MNVLLTRVFRRGIAHGQSLGWMRSTLCLATLLIVLPALAEAQLINSPFDTGLTALQSLFTGTVAKVASLIAIVIGGYQFAHGEPLAKKIPQSAALGRPRCSLPARLPRGTQRWLRLAWPPAAQPLFSAATLGPRHPVLAVS
jgi:type IV secretory pathway VirB2 component (pilin)